MYDDVFGPFVLLTLPPEPDAELSGSSKFPARPKTRGELSFRVENDKFLAPSKISTVATA